MTTRSTTSVPPPTEQELRLYDIGAQLGEAQLGAIQQQSQLQGQFGAYAQPLMESIFGSLGISPQPGIGMSNPNQSLLPQQPQPTATTSNPFTLQSGMDYVDPETGKQITPVEWIIRRNELQNQPANAVQGATSPSLNLAGQPGTYTSPGGTGVTPGQPSNLSRSPAPASGSQQMGQPASQGLTDELTQLQLGQVRNLGQATDYETQLINQAVDMALASGSSDIDTAFQESLDILKQNLAPSLGLRPGDSPIIDRGGKLGMEALRQKSQLSNQLRGQQANQMLNFPLQRGGQLASQAGSLQNFLQNLEQQSFANRAQLLGSISSGGLGLAGMGGSGNTLAALSANRPSSTTSSNPYQAAAGIGGLLYGAGSIFGGAGAGAASLGTFSPYVPYVAGTLGAGTLLGASSKKYKNRTGSVDVFDVLDGLKKLTIHKWKYKGDTVEHLGPYAEDFKELFGVGDGKSIHLIDVMGVALASLKAMALQMENEHGATV